MLISKREITLFLYRQIRGEGAIKSLQDAFTGTGTQPRTQRRKIQTGYRGRGFIDRLQKRPLTPASTEKTKRAYVLIGNIRDFCGVDHREKRANFPKSA